MADSRARRVRLLRRTGRAARRWAVLGVVLGGADAVLIPYAGFGVPDAFLSAAAAGSILMAVFRWYDHRRLSRLPVPAPTDQPTPGAGAARAALRMVLAGSPVARAAVDEVGRRAGRRRFRGSAAAGVWDRLDVAAGTLDDLRPPFDERVTEARTEAAAGERSLRELAERILAVERALRFARGDARPPLAGAHRTLLARLQDGVSTYERLVAATVAWVAEEGLTGDPLATIRLTEAADRMASFAQSLVELRNLRTVL